MVIVYYPSNAGTAVPGNYYHHYNCGLLIQMASTDPAYPAGTNFWNFDAPGYEIRPGTDGWGSYEGITPYWVQIGSTQTTSAITFTAISVDNVYSCSFTLNYSTPDY